MTWQDSFVPDAITPPAAQSQGWQSSFVPEETPPPLTEATLSDVGNSLKGEIEGTGDGGGPISLALQFLGHTKRIADNQERPPGYPTGQEGLNDQVPVDPSMAAAAMGMTSSVAGNPLHFTRNPFGNGPSPDGIITPKSGDIKLIQEKLEMAGITPEQYAIALMKSSPDEFAGELGGEALRMQTQAQAKITGPAMQAARDAMRQRLAEAPQRTQQIIENTFFPSSSTAPTVGGDSVLAASPLPQIRPIEQMQQNLVDIKEKLPDLYDAAYNSTVNSTVGRRGSLGVINTPAGQRAMKDTVTNLANQGIRPESAGIVIDPENGFHGLATKVPVSTLNEVQKSLGQQINRNPNTGAIEDHASQVIEGMRKHITSYLSDNSPQFDTANTNAAANFQGTNAFEMGRKLAHSSAGENADALMQRADNAFSAQELSHFKAGYAQGLSDSAIGTSLGGGSPASRIAKGTVTQTSSDIIGPTQAQKFAEALMKEKSRVELAQRGLYGANTAESLSAGLPEVPTTPHGALLSVGNKIMDFVNAGKQERQAQLLYATSPEQKALLAKMLVGK